MDAIRRISKQRRGHFVCIEARLDCPAEALQAVVERVTTESMEAGAEGVEERETAAGTLLLIYAPAAAAPRVRRAALGELAGSGSVADAVPVPDENWSQTWQHAHSVIEVSPRFVVRPSFARFEATAGQLELVIDPGQAFGTGGHASTLLALESIDARCFESGPPERVLDVGTGTGVLGLAALRLGAKTVLACDIDPIAVLEARRWAKRNELAGDFHLFAGGIDALAASRFDWIFANLLSRELLPLVPELPHRLLAGGRLVVSGLLAIERSAIESRFAAVGLEVDGERRVSDADGVEWISLRLVAA